MQHASQIYNNLCNTHLRKTRNSKKKNNNKKKKKRCYMISEKKKKKKKRCYMISEKYLLNPIAPRKSKLLYNLGLSECNRVKYTEVYKSFLLHET